MPKKNTIDDISKNNLEKDIRKEENKQKKCHKNKEDNKQNIPSSSDNNDYFSDKTTGIENKWTFSFLFLYVIPILYITYQYIHKYTETKDE